MKKTILFAAIIPLLAIANTFDLRNLAERMFRNVQPTCLQSDGKILCRGLPISSYRSEKDQIDLIKSLRSDHRMQKSLLTEIGKELIKVAATEAVKEGAKQFYNYAQDHRGVEHRPRPCVGCDAAPNSGLIPHAGVSL